MLRHLSAVILSALIGSTLGTLIWAAWEGGTGDPNPVRFVAGFALFTMMFTIPGAIGLMYLALKLAERGLTLALASLPLAAAGTLGGAGMLAFSTPYFMALGALYGLLTAAAFVAALSVLKGYRSPFG